MRNVAHPKVCSVGNSNNLPQVEDFRMLGVARHCAYRQMRMQMHAALRDVKP